MFVCKFICLFVPYTNSHFLNRFQPNFCTHLSHRLEETVRYVWSENVWLFSNFLTCFIGSQCGLMGTKWPPAEDFSATALYPCFLRVFAGPHGNYVVSDDTCLFIHDSVISVILTGVCRTSRKLRCIRRHLFIHPRQRYIRDSCLC
jgi:hypothetical protein